jgi:hypothetical protein
VKEIISNIANGKEKLDETFLEAAKSSVLFSIIAREVQIPGMVIVKCSCDDDIGNDGLGCIGIFPQSKFPRRRSWRKSRISSKSGGKNELVKVFLSVY